MRPVRTQILIGIYVAVATVMAASYFISYPIPRLVTRLWEGGVALFLAVAATATGRAILRFTGWDAPFDSFGSTPPDANSAPTDPDHDRSPEVGMIGTVRLVAMSLAVGLIPLALGLLALGTAGFFTPRWIALATLVWGGLGVAQWRRALHRLGGRPGQDMARSLGAPLATGKREGPLGFWSSVVVVIVLGVGYLAALAPPTYYDSLVYHLALPLRYLQEGRIDFVPYNQYGHFPQNMEMIFGWFLAAHSDVSAHLFNGSLAALTGALLWSVGGKNPRRARWDVLLFATAPCVLLLSTETYVEMPLALYTFLAVWAADRGVKENRRAWLILSGLMGGFAAGIKYTGVMTPALLSVLVVFWKRPVPWRKRWADGFCLGGTALALFVPWMIKNYVMTGGNPVFPFLPSIFPAKNVFMFAESSRAYFEVLSEYKGRSSLLMELVQMPWRLLRRPQSFGGGYDVTGDMGWALPLILSPLALLTLRRGRGLMVTYTIVHVLIWASLRPVLRFLFPVFPLVCLLAGEGLSLAMEYFPTWLRRVGAAGLVALGISNGIVFFQAESARDPWTVALGLMSRSDYLRRKLDYYPAMEFVNRNLPLDAKVLFVGDQRSYYCERRHLTPMGLLPTPLRPWTEESPDGAALGRRLRAMGFTHIFFNFREARRLEGYRVLDLSDHGRRVFDELLKSIPVIYNDAATAVFSLPA